MKSAWSTNAVIGIFIALFCIFTTISTTIALNGHALSLNENQILYLFSTSAQVIAAIYGLTLTGFIFFRNELNREELEDETLSDAVESLKARYFILLVFITILVSIALLLANLAIIYEGSGAAWLTTLIINAGQSAFLTTLFAIAYFIFDVVGPKRIERASKSLQNVVDPNTTGAAKGSLEEFLRNYNGIEVLLGDSGQAFTATIHRQPRRLSNTRLAEILLRNDRIDEHLFFRLRELITLRNSIIHGADPIVSQAMVNASKSALEHLRASLGQEPQQ